MTAAWSLYAELLDFGCRMAYTDIMARKPGNVNDSMNRKTDFDTFIRELSRQPELATQFFLGLERAVVNTSQARPTPTHSDIELSARLHRGPIDVSIHGRASDLFRAIKSNVGTLAGIGIFLAPSPGAGTGTPVPAPPNLLPQAQIAPNLETMSALERDPIVDNQYRSVTRDWGSPSSVSWGESKAPSEPTPRDVSRAATYFPGVGHTISSMVDDYTHMTSPSDSYVVPGDAVVFLDNSGQPVSTSMTELMKTLTEEYIEWSEQFKVMDATGAGIAAEYLRSGSITEPQSNRSSGSLTVSADLGGVNVHFEQTGQQVAGEGLMLSNVTVAFVKSIPRPHKTKRSTTRKARQKRRV